MGGDAVERRRKRPIAAAAPTSGDTRLLAAGRANRDSGGRRQPTDTDGRAEVKSSTRRTSHASATATRCLRANSPPPGRLNMPAGLYQGSRGPWRETQVNRRGLRRAHKLFTANENYLNSRLHQSLRCLRPQDHQDSSIHTLFGLKTLGDACLHPIDKSLGPLT